jgi:hypothetical protein
MLKTSLPVFAALCAGVLVIAAQPGQSADPNAHAGTLLAQAGIPQKSPEVAEPSTRSRTRRLPAYYGQVGLSPRQRETIYSLQGAYADRIDELERQLESLKARRDQEIEAVLTPPQKARLHQLLEAAARRRASRSKSAAAEADVPVADKAP